MFADSSFKPQSIRPEFIFDKIDFLYDCICNLSVWCSILAIWKNRLVGQVRRGKSMRRGMTAASEFPPQCYLALHSLILILFFLANLFSIFVGKLAC